MKINWKKLAEGLVPAGIAVLGLAQMALTNHKDTVDRAKMKADITKDVIKELTEK